MEPWWQELLNPSLWDWGDVATWFTGIVTAATFWLGFIILRSDRKNEERSQAAKIAIYAAHFLEAAHEEDGWQIDVHVWNHSDRPIFDAHFHGTYSSGSMLFRVGDRWDEDRPGGTILPGESAKLNFKNTEHIDKSRLYVTFSDANRVEWKYNTMTRKLSKLKYRRIRGRELRETGVVAKAKLD
jgi:hypothetical protein